MMDQLTKKKMVARKALEYVGEGMIIGIGSGSTVNCFIDELKAVCDSIKGVVCASKESEMRCRALGLEVLDANSISSLEYYIDGADEVTEHGFMIKGGGAALTREKIIASIAQKFICIVDESKEVRVLGRDFPLPIEVIPMARSFVAREIVKLGGIPEYRQGVVTDNGNVILDVHNFEILQPLAMEERLNNIAGVVTCGIFARQSASIILTATDNGVKVVEV